MRSVNTSELIASIKVVLQKGDIVQLHSELQKLTASQISDLLLHLNQVEQSILWKMIPLY